MSERFSWTVHPARARPIVALVVVTLVAAVAWIAALALTTQPPLLAIVFSLLLLSSVSSFLLPTRYELDAGGLTVVHLGTRRTRKAADVRRVELGRAVAVLSPFATRRPLDRFRALVVPLDGAPAGVRELLAAWRTQRQSSSTAPSGASSAGPS